MYLKIKYIYNVQSIKFTIKNCLKFVYKVLNYTGVHEQRS